MTEPIFLALPGVDELLESRDLVHALPISCPHAAQINGQIIAQRVVLRTQRKEVATVLIASIIGFCILLLVLAFLFPRLSRHPEHGGQRVLGMGQRAGSSAPGRLGKWLSKPFSSARRAVSKSGSAGRRGRSKMPV